MHSDRPDGQARACAVATMPSTPFPTRKRKRKRREARRWHRSIPAIPPSCGDRSFKQGKELIPADLAAEKCLPDAANENEGHASAQIGRASCRERVCQYV